MGGSQVKKHQMLQCTVCLNFFQKVMVAHRPVTVYFFESHDTEDTVIFHAVLD